MTWLSTHLQKCLTVLLLSLTLLIGTAFGNGIEIQAGAQSLLLETSYQTNSGNSANERTFRWYQDQKPLQSFMREADVDRSGKSTTTKSNSYRSRGGNASTIDLEDSSQVRRSQQKLKGVADNAREKLNLD
jgi:hypothetical protein